jgi:hypothetical protein
MEGARRRRARMSRACALSGALWGVWDARRAASAWKRVARCVREMGCGGSGRGGEGEKEDGVEGEKVLKEDEREERPEDTGLGGGVLKRTEERRERMRRRWGVRANAALMSVIGRVIGDCVEQSAHALYIHRGDARLESMT